MDVYNFGLESGIKSLAGHTNIGLAKVIATAPSELGENAVTDAGFYATAYSWQGSAKTSHITISYRGTNPDLNLSWNLQQVLDSPGIKDAWNGWRLAGGYNKAGQAQLAKR